MGQRISDSLFLKIATWLLGGAAVLTAPIAISQQTARPVSPEARSILGDKSYRFEINLTPRGGVRVDTIASLHPLPDTMTFRLYKDDRTSKSITLQAVAPPPGSSIVYQQPQYSGAYDPANGPYVAFELQFPLGPGDIKTYRAKMAAEEQKGP